MRDSEVRRTPAAPDVKVPRSRARLAWKLVRGLMIGIALLVLILAAGAYVYMTRSLPRTSGSVQAAGLNAPVEVVRDSSAVAHIFAQDEHDAEFALGYVHAQDRLWQMEFQRRVVQGRLSEILGPDTLEADEYMRTIGIHRAAEAAWPLLPADARATVQAYVAGVNAFVSAHSGSRLPPEYTILGVKPELWTPVDVLGLVKLMAFNMAGNFAAELLGADLVRAVGAERAAQLLPTSPATDLTIVPERTWPSQGFRRSSPGDGLSLTATHRQLLSGIRRLKALTGVTESTAGIGSNAWVIDGARTTTGKPLLASDPHLGAQIPSTWYLAHLSAGPLDVIGATIPGLPAVVIGRNRSIAWGLTNLYADTQDLFRERLDARGTAAEFEGRMEPLQFRRENIAVHGREPKALTIRISRHGPLISDIEARKKPTGDAKAQDVFALRWTALDPDDTSIISLLRINTAGDWHEFRGALGHLVAPALGYVYADTRGNIGFVAAGRIPIRRSGDGSLPAEGWSGRSEWTGAIPANAAVSAYNPPDHLIISANNRPAPPDYPYLLGTSWEKPYRAERILQLLDTRSRLSAADMQDIQTDTVSLEALTLVPKLLALVKPENATEGRALELLRRWDGNMNTESPAAALFAEWRLRLPGAIAGDELGRTLVERYSGWSDLYVSRFLTQVFRDPHNPWWDVVTTPQHEDCRAIAGQTLREAIAGLNGRFGAEESQWRWGRLHHASFPHQPFTYVPGLRLIFDRSAVTGGGSSTVNVGEYGADPSFTQNVVSAYRQVVDLSDPNAGRFILAVGQSGHPLSAHYDDLLRDWRDGRYRSMPLDRAAVMLDAKKTLWLRPR